ncbi:hypothetical protein [Flavobacterium sp. GSA192]|uniref:hypothetical protein n=1 Tax=Flavobacterium sp. GSA192 TaxID=2576304 RepID=UPI00112A0D74|nr:hypothetical protein [Flavobacterium sp. GSA192]
MESIKKIYSIILDRNQGGQGEGGNCKVVAFTRDKDYIKDEETIKDFFQTDSKIFSDKIFKFLPDGAINQLVEIIPGKINTEIIEGRNYYIHLKSIKKTGSLIIDVPYDYLKTNYINLEDLNNYFESKEYFKEELGSFYLCDNEKIFGPFKTTNGKIQPKKDTFVHSFQYDIENLIEVENFKFSYLLEEPQNKIDVIDCMTVSQLMEFLKNQLSIDRAEINLISKTYDNIKSLNRGNSSLDIGRLERASGYLSDLKLSYEELRKIGYKQDEWGLLVNKIIIENKVRFEEETLKEIEKKIQVKEVLKNEILSELNKKHAELEKIKSQQDDLVKELENITNKKEDLILSIQLAAGINNGSVGVKNELVKNYYEIISSNNLSSIIDLDDFYDELESKISSKSELKNTLYILKENRFIIGNSTELILNSIQHLGSYEIMIQNAEADWLKFKCLEENGFSIICQKAMANIETPHFFILQDFNVASFECYGKSILDIRNGVRTRIPGMENDWPDNLFFILIAVDAEIDDFGFSINKSTFKKWAFLPHILDYSYQKINTKVGLNLAKLEVNNQYPDFSDNYLS